MANAEVAYIDGAYETTELGQALYDYPGGPDGTLPLKYGDIIEIISKASDEWWTGFNRETKEQGHFPANYVGPYYAVEVAETENKPLPVAPKNEVKTETKAETKVETKNTNLTKEQSVLASGPPKMALPQPRKQEPKVELPERPNIALPTTPSNVTNSTSPVILPGPPKLELPKPPQQAQKQELSKSNSPVLSGPPKFELPKPPPQQELPKTPPQQELPKPPNMVLPTPPAMALPSTPTSKSTEAKVDLNDMYSDNPLDVTLKLKNVNPDESEDTTATTPSTSDSSDNANYMSGDYKSNNPNKIQIGRFGEKKKPDYKIEEKKEGRWSIWKR